MRFAVEGSCQNNEAAIWLWWGGLVECFALFDDGAEVDMTTWLSAFKCLAAPWSKANDHWNRGALSCQKWDLNGAYLIDLTFLIS